MNKKLLLETDTPDSIPDGETGQDDVAIEAWIDEWDSADDKRREIIAREILQKWGKNSQERTKLTNFVDSFRHSCYEFGVDWNHNPFMEYIYSLTKNIKTTSKEDAYVNRLVELVSTGSLSKDAIREAAQDKDHFLMNPSLFYRNEKDFEYTVKVWDIVTSPEKVKQFLKDVSKVDINQFYEDGKPGGKIKPAGNEATAYDRNKDGTPKTIYGVIEAWSDNNELEDSNSGDKRKAKKPIQYSPAQLEKIKEKKYYSDLSAIPDEEEWENNVVYVYFKDDMVKGKGDPNNWIDTWMIYKDGKWSKYEP